MNILIISAVFPPEPVVSARLSYDLASELTLRNKVTVISPRPTRPYGFKFEPDEKENKFEHLVLKSYVCPQSKQLGRFIESFSFGRVCYRFLSKNHKSIDIIYANTWQIFAQYFVVRAAKRYHIPIIMHVQDIYPESLSKKLPLLGPILNVLLLPLDKYVMKNSTNVIAISDKMGAYLVKTRGLDKSKVHVVQNWQDETVFIMHDEYEKDQSGSNEPFTFMYLGNIGPVAGVELLIGAFAIVGLENSRLVIAGSGSMKVDAIKRVQKNHEARIEFWDVPDGKEAEVQSMADVMLLPLKKGNTVSSVPSKLPAYMFSAKPIIASLDAGSDTARVITNSGCGWLIKPEDEEELASMMKFVFSLDKQKLKDVGIKGRHYALENFSKQKNLQKLVQIIEQTTTECNAEKQN